MGTVELFRFTNTSDTTTSGAEKITLDDSADVNSVKAIIDKDAGGIQIVPTSAVGDNQGAEMEFGDKQSLGTFEKIYVIPMVIFQMKPDSGTNSIIDTITKWDEQSKENTGKFDQGRFGIEMGDLPKLNFLPIPTTGSNPQGLMWLDISYNPDFENNQLKILLRLTVSKGNGT